MRLRSILRPVYSRILIPWARFYLRKTRHSHYQDVQVAVPPGVFHPGLYLSTRFMLRHLQGQAIASKRLWEIGAGSGMVAIWCAKRGAQVTATDISHAAVDAIKDNAAQNGVPMQVLHADLFDGLPPQPFDWILINPPYYPAEPNNEAENAFYCGAEFQYFERLFSGLLDFCQPQAELRMVLSEDCELDKIKAIATKHRWEMVEVERMKKVGEYNFIFALHHQT